VRVWRALGQGSTSIKKRQGSLQKASSPSRTSKRRLEPAKLAFFKAHAEKPRERGGFGWSKPFLKHVCSNRSNHEAISKEVDRLTAQGGSRGAATRARTRMQADLAELARPSDADDDEHDAAQGRALAAKATGKCPTCRKPFPRKLVSMPQGLAQLVVKGDNADCVVCFASLEVGKITYAGCDCGSFCCLECAKRC